MGFIAGVFGVIFWTFTPSPTAFVFTPFQSAGEFGGSAWALVVSILPRLLAGLLAGIVCKALKKRKELTAYIAAGLTCSIVNTVGVLGFIYIFFGQTYASVLGVAYSGLLVALGITVVTNGFFEAAVCGLVTPAVCKPLNKFVKARA
jgi:uncharacterized membrane protein